MRVRYRCRCGAEIEVEWHPHVTIDETKGEYRLAEWQNEHLAHVHAAPDPTPNGPVAGKDLHT